MARPNSYGLNYFSIDTDMFMNRKIRRLLKAFGSKGFLIYMYILTEIYRDKGCFLLWDENTAFDVSDYLNLSENVVNEVVAYCFDVGLFDKELHESEKILTSKNIQIRWEKISREAKRKICKVGDINKKYSLIQEETEFTPEETQNTTEETQQRKEKERKEEESFKTDIEKRIFNSLEKPINQTFTELANDERWLENIAMNYHLKSTYAVKVKLNEFYKHLQNIGQEYKSISDAKSHFTNWINKNK